MSDLIFLSITSITLVVLVFIIQRSREINSEEYDDLKLRKERYENQCLAISCLIVFIQLAINLLFLFGR